MVNLQTLDLTYNELHALPVSVCRLTNLYYLNLNNNKIRIIPGSIRRLVNLRYLYLQDNPLVVISFLISQCPMENLYLSTNPSLKTLPVSLKGWIASGVLEGVAEDDVQWV